MSYRLLADENIERATVNYLKKLGHDIVRVQGVSALGAGAPDDQLVVYANENNRLILSQDDDFFTEINPEETAGVLAQRDQQLSAREVGDIVNEMSNHLPQHHVTLEYVTVDWL